MSTNKPGGSNKQGAHLLQGLITCGVCGYGFASKRNHYICRGTMKYNHPDGKAKCQAPNLRMDWLENQVWGRIEEILNDPNKLVPMINDSIENLKSSQAELSARIRPIDEQLAEIADQQARLIDDYVMRHAGTERYKQL